MSPHRTQWCAAVLVMSVGAAVLFGCSRRKQVPFGLEEAASSDGASSSEADTAAQDESEDEANGTPALPVGEVFGPNQVEVPVGNSALVLQEGYALAALSLELDGEEPMDAIVVSVDAREVRLEAAFEQGLGVTARLIDSFLVPDDCDKTSAEIRQLSPSLAAARIDHACGGGVRTNVWVVTIEAQPRVRERITVLPPNQLSTVPIELDLRAEDRDQDGYEDVVVDLQIGEIAVPLAWLNRPGGFARDVSQPEATLRSLADDAWAFLDSDLEGSEKRAQGVLDAFIALCRESGTARIGLAGTQGIQCRQSAATGRALAAATVAAIRRGRFVRALELQRWWRASAVQATAEERDRVQSAWQRAKASANASWKHIHEESATTTLYFVDDETLVIDGFTPKSIDLRTGSMTPLARPETRPPIQSPDGRFTVRGVRVTCAGYEAEVAPKLAKRSHRVLIESRPGTIPCQTPIDRPASVFEWAVLGWAPQGLLVGSGDQLRIVPLNELGKPAGRPVELEPGNPLPAPVHGARITPDGQRYVIPHTEGVVVRDWRKGGAGLWLRPADWDAASGELRAVAISPNGQRVALQKGNEIRLLTW